MQLGLQPLEVGHRALWIDERAIEHCANVVEVLLMTALELRQRLRIEIEVIERDAIDVTDETTRSSQPSGTGMKSAGDANSTLI